MIDDYKNASGAWAKTAEVEGRTQLTRAYMLYMSMLDRCKEGGKFQKKKPTYLGCRCEFKDFQEFAEWCHRQVGYNEPTYQLDKDLLGDGKTYSPDKCVFLPRKINLLISKKSRSRSIPQGVYLHKCGKYVASVNINNEITYLGIYDTMEEASSVYNKRKEQEVRRVAEEFKGKMDETAFAKIMEYEVPK